MNTSASKHSDSDMPPGVLDEILSDGFNPGALPADVSMDFSMTPDNLFAMWSQPSARLRSISAQPQVAVNWVLASDNVMEQAQKAFQDSPVLAMMSLSDIQALLDQMDHSTWFKKATALFKKVYFVQDNGQKVWSSSKKGSVLFEGDLKDLKKLAAEGQAFIDNNNYRDVFDVRPVQTGHPRDWIQFMRHPKIAMMLRKELEERGMQ